jgi:dTDP-6-deoxy-L-talose 4-dehydrogenase (NAD+)
LTETRPARPITAYGFAKDTLRRQLEFLGQNQPFDLTWARLFYTYGEGQAPTSLLPLLAAAAARGDTHFAMSSGEQLRDYLPVRDVAAKLAALALRDSGAGIVNVCAGKPISVRGLVDSWIAENGWRIVLDRGKYPIPDYEPMAFWGDDALFNSLF